MDAATAERINNLAKNLKDLHLASSMEDAMSKAREIILGTQGSGKTVKEMMVEEEGVLRETRDVEAIERQSVKQAEQIQESVSEVKEAQTKVEFNNAELAAEATRVGEQLKKHQIELAKIREEIESAKRALDEAKRTKEHFERQTPAMQPRESTPQMQPQERRVEERRGLSEEEKKKSDLSRIFNFGKR
jgi:hypothetical protein